MGAGSCLGLHVGPWGLGVGRKQRVLGRALKAGWGGSASLPMRDANQISTPWEARQELQTPLPSSFALLSPLFPSVPDVFAGGGHVFPNTVMLPWLPGSSKPCGELVGPRAAVKPVWAAGLRVESAPDVGRAAFPSHCLILSALFCLRGNPATAPQLWGRAALPRLPGGCQIFT